MIICNSSGKWICHKTTITPRIAPWCVIHSNLPKITNINTNNDLVKETSPPD